MNEDWKQVADPHDVLLSSKGWNPRANFAWTAKEYPTSTKAEIKFDFKWRCVVGWSGGENEKIQEEKRENEKLKEINKRWFNDDFDEYDFED